MTERIHSDNRERFGLTPRKSSVFVFCFVLLLTFLIRAFHAGQPIVENYVGRQVPTAMVARNLERGSGLLRPRLDTAPFPNYFVVEPPIYECGVIAVRRSLGLSLEAAGRVLSALATVLAAWGLFELALPRQGRARLSWPYRPSLSFHLRYAMDEPFSPTPRCSALSWPDWPAGIAINSVGVGTGSPPAGLCWRLALRSK